MLIHISISYCKQVKEMTIHELLTESHQLEVEQQVWPKVVEEIDEQSLDVRAIVVLVCHDHHLKERKLKERKSTKAIGECILYINYCFILSILLNKFVVDQHEQTLRCLLLFDCLSKRGTFPYRKSEDFFLSKDKPRIFTIFIAFKPMPLGFLTHQRSCI